MERSVENASKTILVVDDDESVLSFLSFSLKEDRFKVLEADNAEHAWTLLEKNPVDLVLLDIMLPQMNGFQMCKKMREEERFSKTPVLFITAYADPTSLSSTKECGAQGLIEKPLMYNELLIQIIDALNGRFSLPTRLKYAA